MRWLWGALFTSAIALAGCGSSGGGDQATFGDDGGADDVTVGPSGPGLQLESGAGEGGPGSCTPRTCAQAGANCGPVADGCGGLIQCGNCTAPASCGGGGTPSVCGGTSACVAKTCQDLGANCGPQGDGCGNVIPCGNCNAPQTCGGGGTASQCGGSAACVPLTTCPAGQNCGVVADGCGGVVDCSGGQACPNGTSCGGGGTPNVCGSKNVLPDGGIVDAGGDAGSLCTPISKTTACANMNCGVAPDGCGKTYTCGTCTKAGDTCGGGGVANQCGQPACVPLTACPANIKCGTYANGCGGTLQCGTCGNGTTCGGGGTPYQCGKPACTPLTQCPAGVNCGPYPDGCGGIIGGANGTCGTCNSPAICGGSNVPSQCGDGTDGGFVCQGLQCNQVQCDGGATTSISGIVYDPAGKNPVYNAVVFVPSTSTALPDFKKGVSCDTCADQETSLIEFTTGPDGKFSLKDVPVVAGGTPVVFQIGRWRREILVNVKACQDNALTVAQTHLPTTHDKTKDATQANDLRDDIPLMAISTGSADPFECLLVKMGIQTSEFVNPTTDTTGGRIHYYHQNGVDLDNSVGGPAPDGSTLWTAASTLENSYDIVLLPCEGSPNDHGDSARTNIADYANKGGRIFVTHYSYEWAAPGNTGDPWGSVATWDEDQPFLADPSPDWCQDSNNSIQTPTTITGTVNQAFQKGADFATWLQNVGATTTKGQLVEHEARHDVDGIPANSVATPWITFTGVNTKLLDATDKNGNCSNSTEQASSSKSLQHMTFNTPINAPVDDAGVPEFCGRVVYSDFHVSASALTSTKTFPGSCATGSLSAQEKALEFMLFDLSSCIQPDNPPAPPNPTCTKATSCPSNVKCGVWPDGCGGDLTCGTCPANQFCVNGGCVGCNAGTCQSEGIVCGQAGDGCGGTLTCNTCPQGQLCQNNACITPTCNKVACPANIKCGPAGDGCGGIQDCGDCGPGQTCGGGGQPGVCGAADASACAPISCADQHIQCGPTGDGCGNVIQCGTCPAGQTCGGGGQPGVCGAPNCTPKTCADLGANCGQVADGCGGLTPDCGQCVNGQTCGGGGTPNQCGQPACTPRTCQQAGANCGPIADGCGGVVQCGDCSPPQTCGGGGTPSVCGGGIK